MPDGSATEKEHHEAHVDALSRNVAGLEHRLLELQGMEAATPDQLAAAEEDIKHARKVLLDAAGTGQKKAAKRPKSTKAKETR